MIKLMLTFILLSSSLMASANSKKERLIGPKTTFHIARICETIRGNYSRGALNCLRYVRFCMKQSTLNFHESFDTCIDKDFETLQKEYESKNRPTK